MGRGFKDNIPAFLAFLLLLYFCFGLPLQYPAPFAKDGEMIGVVIPHGASAREAAKKIAAAGVVGNSDELVRWMVKFGIDRSLKPGLYMLRSGNAVDAARQLKNATPLVESATLIPGMRYTRVAEVLRGKDELPAAVAAELENNNNFPEQVRDKLPAKAEDRIAFLMPDTFYIAPGSDRISQIIRNSSKLWWDKIGTKLPENINKDDLLTLATLASIIEGEAKVSEERPVLAGIFLSRIEKKMRLQSCATVIYSWEARGVKKNALTYKDLEIDSPYNTYQNDGLPPGPISIPSAESWDSAVNPEKTEYLFFFATPSGKHIFSKTYEEHLRRQREAAQ